ncbi:MAG: hypothetical protein KJ709_01525 [Nanoarchaeota archaeon]|nr:hypothetical protein [Nanoarchaeota archaeon]
MDIKNIVVAFMFLLVIAPVSALSADNFKNMRIERAQVYNEIPGSKDVELETYVRVKNDMKSGDYKVTVTMPELDIRRSFGPDRIGKGKTLSKNLRLDIPKHVEPGEYVMRIVLSDGSGNRRVKHRYVEIS